MTQDAKKYHFIGIGGIGMSGLARILIDQKNRVSGSDLSVSETTQQLIQRGAEVSNGHAACHVSPGDLVVYSSQIQKNNPEYQAAVALKCPMMHRSELLAHLMKGHKSLAVAGTHGKTTTSALLSTVLVEAGCDPTFAIGGMCRGLNGKSGGGTFFVAEADESDGSFLNYHPHGAIVTNIEAEHLDHHQTIDHLKQAFLSFISQVRDKEWLFYCGDDPLLHSLYLEGISYGFGSHNLLQIKNFKQRGWSSSFDLLYEGKFYSEIDLSLIGQHNALNAAAVFGLALKLGISEESIRKTFQVFPGVGRRSEKKGEEKGILFLDDYGHHPTEIATTLKAIKKAVQDRRLVVLFQPHRYTRTRDLLHEFSTAFEWADLLIVTDIYAACEDPIAGVTPQILIHHIRNLSTVPCRYISRHDLLIELNALLCPHDVLLTQGAGDITHFYKEFLPQYQPRKLTVGLVCGGRSCEHEISLRSSRFVAQSLNRSLYDLRFFGIDKEGKWVVGPEAEKQLMHEKIIASPQAKHLLDPQMTQELQACDLFLPILHGTFGEDGTIQGFFDTIGKPYMGPDLCSAAICMDKVLTKRVVQQAGVPTPRDLTFRHLQWLDEREKMLSEITQRLPFPVYVKPVHLGSSVAVTPVYEKEKLSEAIDLVFRYDTQVIVEEGKVGCRELEFAVLGNTGGFFIGVPGPGEKMAEGGFVDYEKKYGAHAIKSTVTPDLTPELLEKGKKLARQAYEAIGCSGLTRVDFMLDCSGEFWLFEMNPIPGLTPLSLFPKIWHREGLTGKQLFDQLIILALARHRQHKRHYRCLEPDFTLEMC